MHRTSSPPRRGHRTRRHISKLLIPLVTLAFFAVVGSAQAHFANATTACSASTGNSVTFLWTVFPAGTGNGGENQPTWQIVYTPSAGGAPTTLSGQVTFPSGPYSLTVAIPGGAGTAVASSAWTSAQTTTGSEGTYTTNLTIPNCLATPSVTTTASGGIAAGGQISDQATLTGGSSPTGTMTFKLYAASDTACSNVLATETAPVNGSGNYTSPALTENSAGSYQWTASYSGDANNAPAADNCNEAAEQVTVSKVTPSLSTVASPTVLAGGPIFDAGNLSGGAAPTGTITFTLYAASDTSCSTPLSTGTATVSHGDGTYSSQIVNEKTVGSYLWRATYSGDANNLPASETCGAAAENVKVTSNPPGGVIIGKCASVSPHFSGVGGKAGRTVTARVTASGVKSVTFYLDHHKLKTLTKAHHGFFSITINTRKVSYGHHTVSAKANMVRKGCKPVSLQGRFVRINTTPPPPKVTG